MKGREPPYPPCQGGKIHASHEPPYPLVRGQDTCLARTPLPPLSGGQEWEGCQEGKRRDEWGLTFWGGGVRVVLLVSLFCCGVGVGMGSFFYDILESAAVFVYPSGCRVCGVALGLESMPYICGGCWGDIRFVERPWCDICGVPGVVGCCDSCATVPPRYGKLRSVAFYEASVQVAIQLLKFEKKRVFAGHLCSLMNRYLEGLASDFRVSDYDGILPVPIHRRRLRERGFNQAELLARGLGAVAGVPVITGALVRGRHTVAQSGLGGVARQQNIVGAFSVAVPGRVAGKRVLLVDDVFTTGATIGEAVSELWGADPVEVDVLTLARGRGVV